MSTHEISRLLRPASRRLHPSDRSVEHAFFCLAIVIGEAFDVFASSRFGFGIATGLLIAVLLRRPALAPIAFAVAFTAETIMRFPAVGIVAAPQAAFDCMLELVTWLVARRVYEDGRRIRTGRSLVEILIIVAIAAPLLAAGLSALLIDTALGSLLDVARYFDWPGDVLGAAVILPIVLVAGRDEIAGGLEQQDLLATAAAAVAVAVVAWGADRWFPFPFIVACIPLLLAATRLPPVIVAVLGAGCMIEMSTLASGHGDLAGPRALAAALTGTLPTGLALVLAELRTERRRLKETGEQLRKVLVGIAGHGYYELDRQGRVVHWDEKIAAMTGYTTDAVLGRSFAQFLPQEDRDAGVPAALLAQAAETGRAERIGWRLRADGSRFWARVILEARYDAHGKVVGFVKSVQDQTELQRSQAALMATERRWGFALGSAGQGVWEHDLVAGTMDYSDLYSTMLGLAPGALGNDPQTWKARVHPDDRALVPPDDAAGSGEIEFRMRHAEGRWIWVTDRRSIAERDAAGRPVRIIGAHTDVTARKLAEEKFRLAVEAAPNGLLMADIDGRITLANRETERMFGYDRGTLLGRSIDVLVPETRPGSHAALRAAYAATPEVRHLGAGRELNGLRRDGSLVPVEIGLHPIQTAEGASVLCVVTDISLRKKAETELAVSEARYRSMADNFVDLVVQLDLDLTRTWVSPASRDILGVAPEKLLGSSPSSLIHPDDVEDARRELLAVARGAARGGYTARYRHAEGHWLWLTVSLRLINGPDGVPVGILAVARDITRARAAEEALKASETTFRGAMESASIGMALEDPDGRWVSVNRALCGILGATEADLVGREHDFLTHPDDVGIDAEQRRRLVAGEITSYQIEMRCLHRGGSVVWTHRSVSLDRHPDGSPRRLICQIQDITERKQVEQMKSEFVSMVSHELRTPLTSIRGALGLVLGTMGRELPPRAVQLVDIAHKNSERLIPLVNDILDLDKVDAGMLRVDLVETDATRLVDQAIETTRAFADRYGVELRTAYASDPIVVRVDEGRFIQVVTNLLSNAAKFSQRGDVVEVRLRVADGRVRIAVHDEGPGIPEEFRPRIFGRFAQADSATTRAKGGSGLGLHICRQLVGLMGGVIDFESSVGVGSTFWVELPLVASEASTLPSEPRADGRRSVVIVAAEEVLAEFLVTAARGAGLEPRIATADEAPAIVAATAAVAVLVDTPAAADAIAARLRDGEPARQPPPVIPVGVGTGGTAAGHPNVWDIDPGAPQSLVRRLAELAFGAGDRLPRILHVEDDLDFAEVIAAGLAGRAEIVGVARVGRALEILEAERFDLVVIDPVLPDGDAFVLLRPLLDRIGVPYLLLSANEVADADGELAAVTHLVKSRVSEQKLVEAITALLGKGRAAEAEERHVG